MYKRLFFFFLLILCSSWSFSQVVIGGDEIEIDYSKPKDYKIGGITVSGVRYLDEEVLKSLSGLRVGETITIPGDKIAAAVRNLWKQGLLSDVSVRIANVQGDLVFFDLLLTERPRLSRFAFSGVKKSEADKLREKVDLVKGKVITENLKRTTTARIKEYYVEKGYLNAEVDLVVETDSSIQNSELFRYTIKKRNRVKINDIVIEGNEAFSDVRLMRKMKDTKKKKFYRIFKASKYIEENFENDMESIITLYNAHGYRDAKISDYDMQIHNDKTVNLKIDISEGSKYYFRHINWLGNTKYTSEQLSAIAGIKRGDIYNQDRLDKALFLSPNGTDITSLYMDDGYLFFNMQPYEVLVEGDSIDLEIRLIEGKQARVNRVTVVGNTKTNDKVIMREIRTKPGNLFSRSDIIRSQRELAQLGYFNNEGLGVNPKPNPDNGTVDIEYVVEERPSDQVELSGGYGAGQFVGTLGLAFNNFSASNFFKKGAWSPLPAGDGQRLSLRAQSNGRAFQSYNVSFSEPWLGGRKPISFTVSAYTSIQSNGLKRGDENRQSITINGVSVSVGKRLRIPDDFFSIYSTVSLQNYNLINYTNTFLFSDGNANNLSFTQSLSRNSIDDPLFPRSGSSFTASVQFTPPFSLFDDKDYSTLSDNEKYKWIEYHKWKFNAYWYTPITKNRKLVLSTRANFGILGQYNDEIGQSPFERFYLGGDGLSGFALDGREIIALRGYENNSLTPRGRTGYIGGTVYDKFTFELRYLLSPNPNAMVYALTFLEGGNNWLEFKDFSPFDIKRSAGFGVRIFLPMFGMLGLDYGYGIDEIFNAPGTNEGNFHFSIGQQF